MTTAQASELIREAESILGDGPFPTIASEHLRIAKRWLGKCDEMATRHAVISIEVSNNV